MRVLFGASLLMIPVVAGAQVSPQDDGTTRVVVTASRVARLTPDRVAMYAVVEGTAESAVEAAQRADRKLQAVVDAVRQLGSRAEVATNVPWGVAPAPNYGGYPQQGASNPFIARHVLRIQAARVDQVMSVSAALVAAGASNVTPPMFEVAAADSARRARFAETLAQARADAEAIANGLGMRLGTLVSVTANPGPTIPNMPQFLNFSRGFEMSMSGSGSLPEVTVTTTVTATYRLQPR